MYRYNIFILVSESLIKIVRNMCANFILPFYRIVNIVIIVIFNFVYEEKFLI